MADQAKNADRVFFVDIICLSDEGYSAERLRRARRASGRGFAPPLLVATPARSRRPGAPGAANELFVFLSGAALSPC